MGVLEDMLAQVGHETVEQTIASRRRRSRPIASGTGATRGPRAAVRAPARTEESRHDRALAMAIARNRPAWQLLGQLPAGLVQATVADTSLVGDRGRREEFNRRAPWYARAAVNMPDPLQAIGQIITGNRDYRPAIVDNPGALYGIVDYLTSGNMDEQEAQEFVESYGGQSLQRVNAGYERVNETLGIENPQNAAEVIANVAGSMALPIRIPGTSVSAASVAGRAAQRARNFAIEAVVPGRNTNLPTAAAVGGTIGVGLTEGLDAVQDNPQYTSIAETFGSDPVSVEAQAQPFADLNMQAQDQDDPFADLNTGAAGDPFAELNGLSAPPDPVTARTPEDAEADADDWFNWSTALGVVGAALGGYAVYRFGRQVVRTIPQRLEQEIDAGLPALRGLDTRRSRRVGRVRQRVRDLKTSVAQHDQPIRDYASDFLGARYAEERGWDLDRLVNVSLGSRVRDFAVTGRAPGVGGKRYTKLAPILDTYGRELTPEQQQFVDDAVLAARALDDRAAFGTNPSFANRTDDELRAIKNRVIADPMLNKYFDAAMTIGRDMLDFAVRRGLLTNEVAGRWVRKRPHWAPFDRAVTTDADMHELSGRIYTANKNAVSATSATADASSVTEGAVGNPFVALVDRWTNLIRMAEMNDVRVKVITDLQGLGRNPADSKPWVRRLASIERADEENTHIVFNNGTREAYYVADPALSRALHLMPRATAGGFEVARQIMQNFVTGPLGTLTNLFAAAKSPFYDALLGMSLRKPGMAVGNLSELLLSLSGGRIHLGPVDPTAMIGGPTGAARYAWDGLKQGIGQAFEVQLLREHSWIRGLLGDKLTGQLARLFSESYERSTRALMDQLGITSHTIHGSPDPAKTITNLQDVAPAFHSAAAAQIYRDTMKSGPRAMETLLANSTNMYAKLRSSRIARVYTGLVEAMHNGYRYTALATARKQKDFPRRMSQRASQLRRLSGDAAQYGGSEAVNKVTGSIMYAGLTVQVLSEAAMMARKHPVTLALNIGTMVPMIMGLHYLSMMTDDDARQTHMDKSPEQRAASITMFGGAELPVDPLIRMVLSPTMTLFDHLTGIDAGEPNLDLMRAFSNMLDSDTPDEETMWHQMEQQFWANLWANNPVALSGFPLTAPILANYGVDPGMTRFSGEASPVRTQEISGADQDSAQVDALTTAWWQNMIGALTGTFGTTLFGMANDYHRSLRGGSEVSDAVERAGERWTDSLYRGAGPYRPLFGDYEHLIAVGDGNWQQYNQRRDGIDSALRVYNRDVRTSGTTSMTFPMPLQTDIPLPEFQGTVAAAIGAEALMLDRETRHMRQRLSQLGNQAESLRNSYITSREDANALINQNTRERRAIALWLLMRVRAREERVATSLGVPDFTFEDYDPRQYQVPLSATPAASPVSQ